MLLFVPMEPDSGDYWNASILGHVVLYSPTPMSYSPMFPYVASNRTKIKKSSYFVIIKQDREKLESLFFFG